VKESHVENVGKFRVAGFGRLALPLLPVLLLAFCVAFGLIEPRFLRYANILNILRNASSLSLVAAGQMLVIVVGGFDISVSAVVALTSVATALSLSLMGTVLPDTAMLATILGCLLGLAPALIVGLANGLSVSVLKAPPFIVTIGTMSVALGIADYLSGGTPIYGLPDNFLQAIGTGRIAGIPNSIFIAAVTLAILGYVLSATRSGRYFYAVGGNERGARFSGVNVTLYTTIAYVLSGALAGLAGILLTARVGSGEATLGGSLMLESIAAAILAGVSLRGGSGSLPMVVLGAIFLSMISNGLNLIHVDSRYQVIIMGVIVIAAVAVEKLKEKGSST
jgi:ribose transport system permease protein